MNSVDVLGVDPSASPGSSHREIVFVVRSLSCPLAGEIDWIDAN
jgi:hypothetical protein